MTVILVRNDGAKDSQLGMVIGTAKWRKGHLFVDRGAGLPEFPIPDGMIHRVRPVASALRGIFEDADYTIMLNVAPALEQINFSIGAGEEWAKEVGQTVVESPARV